MNAVSLRRWAPLSIPICALILGLALRSAGVLPGWATLLILGGSIGGALVAYAILLGGHARPVATDRLTEEAKLSQFTFYGRTRADRSGGYDGR